MKKFLLATLIAAGCSAGATMPAMAADYMKPAEYTPFYEYAAFFPEISLVWGLQELTMLVESPTATITRDGEEFTIPSSMFSYGYTQLEPPGGGAGFQEDVPDINDPGNKYPDGPGAEDHGDAFNLVKIDLMEYTWFKYGAFVLTIPEGQFANAEGAVNPKQEINFWVYPFAANGEFSIEEGSEVKVEDQALTLTWQDVESVEGLKSAEPTILDGIDENGNDVRYKLYVGKGITLMEDGISFDLSSIPSGFYDLSVAEATVLIKGENGENFLNPTQYYTVRIVNDSPNDQPGDEPGEDAGVSSLIVNGDSDAIYDLSGRKVGDSSVVNNLSKGIYIYKGSKIIK